MGAGCWGLGLGALALEQAQAAAAVGQIGLAAAYDHGLKSHGITVAQVLVTLEDSANRRRYLNSRNTLETLLGFGAVPIVNENDTVATDEIRYGDNDRLAAQVAVTVAPTGWCSCRTWMAFTRPIPTRMRPPAASTWSSGSPPRSRPWRGMRDRACRRAA